MASDIRYRHLHWSGRFDATPTEFDDMVDAAVAHGPHVITGTEAYKDSMERLLAQAGRTPDWDVAYGTRQREQCWALYRSDIFALVHSEQRVLSGKRWHNAKGHWLQPVVAVVAVLRHKRTGAVFAHVAFHTASHVQGYDQPGRVSARVLRGAAWLADVRAANALRKELRKKYGANVIMSADWNLDLRKAWCRAATAAAGGRLTWHKPYPKKGTHGRRLIDGTRISGKKTLTASSLRVLPTVKGFDHRPYVETIHYRATTPKKEPAVPNHLYPGADRSQWFGSGKYAGSPITPNTIVLHTTEGGSWPSYRSGATTPTLTVWCHPNGAQIRQHIRLDRSARALENADGGVETNTLNCIQIELVGSCDRKDGYGAVYWPNPPQWAVDQVGEVLATLHDLYPAIPLKSSVRWESYPDSYGTHNGVRLTGRQWSNYYGILGHQHVPENHHGDPGNIPIGRILAAAIDGTHARPATPAAPEEDDMPAYTDWPKKDRDALMKDIREVVAHYVGDVVPNPVPAAERKTPGNDFLAVKTVMTWLARELHKRGQA